MTKETKKGQKIGVLILYVVILLGLLVGFLIPTDFSAENPFNTTLAMQIPAALDAVLGTFGFHIDALSNLLVANGGSLPALAIAAPMSLAFGDSVISLDFNAWLTIIYAVVTVIAIICIIPAIVGAVTKKTKAEKAAAKADSAAQEATAAAADAASEAGYVQDENDNWKNPFGRYTNKDADGDPIPVDENGNAFAADEAGNLIIPDLDESADEKKTALYNYANAYASAKAATAEAKDADAAAEEALANKKKKKETTVHTTFTLEVIAAVVLLLMNFFIILNMGYNGGTFNIPVFTAFAAIVVVGFIQRTIASKGSGVAKFILFLLSLIAVLVAFFGVAAFSGKLDDLMLEAEGMINDSLGANLTNVVFSGTPFVCFCVFLFRPEGSAITLFAEEISTFEMIFEIGGLIVAIMLLVNCFLDLLGIYKQTNKFMLVVNQIRYLLEIVGLVLCIIGALADSEGTIQIDSMFIVLCFLVVVAYIIELSRLIHYGKAKRKAAKAAAAAEAEEEAAAEEQAKQDALDAYKYPYPEYADDSTVPVTVTSAAANNAAPAAAAQAAPAAAATPAPVPGSDTYYPPVAAVAAVAPAEPAASAVVPADVPVTTTADVAPQAAPEPYVQPVQNANVIYNVHTLYNGPVDKFIAKLTNDEKVQFARVFIERLDGPLAYIPDYKVGGDNTKFFSNVIIYYARVRDLISDSLMNKLYEEAKIM